MEKPETRGRKPEYNTPKSFRDKVDEYFDKCSKAQVFPDLAGMRIHCKVSKADVKEMWSIPEYAEVLEYASNRRESLLIRRMVTDPKAAAGCMNALKEEENGGYMGKTVENEEKTLKVVIDGGYGNELFQ